MVGVYWAEVREVNKRPKPGVNSLQADAPPHFCNSPHGLKPRRGGLFIATNPRRLFFLFFGGAARCSFPDVERGWILPSCSQFSLQRPRRRKTKRKRTIC